MRRAFQISSGTKMFTKPLAILQNLDDSEWLAQIEAVDRFTDNMLAYPGRSFGQLYHRMLKANQLLTGKVNLSGNEIDVAEITAPVLIFAGNTDGIAPINAVKALVPLLRKAHEVRFEIVPGGHLGMLTGRAARGDDLGDDGRVDRAVLHTGRPAGQAAYGRQEGRRQGDPEDGTEGAGEEGREDRAYDEAPRSPRSRSRPPSQRAPKSSGKVSPDRSAIGSNPERRFDSASSRNLTRKS